MQYLKLITAAVLLTFLLAGCGTRTKIVYETHLIVPEDELLQDCYIAPPPDKEKLLQADDVGRQELYVEAWHAQLRSVVNCNHEKRALRDWKAKQLQAHQPKRPDQ